MAQLLATQNLRQQLVLAIPVTFNLKNMIAQRNSRLSLSPKAH
jgi:hypothetical protein